jgi:hypothetical protein
MLGGFGGLEVVKLGGLEVVKFGSFGGLEVGKVDFFAGYTMII